MQQKIFETLEESLKQTSLQHEDFGDPSKLHPILRHLGNKVNTGDSSAENEIWKSKGAMIRTKGITHDSEVGEKEIFEALDSQLILCYQIARCALYHRRRMMRASSDGPGSK